jgi:hypothetical protein
MSLAIAPRSNDPSGNAIDFNGLIARLIQFNMRCFAQAERHAMLSWRLIGMIGFLGLG